MYQAGESLTGYSGYLEVISCGDQRCMLMADRLEAITKLEVVTPHFNTPFLVALHFCQEAYPIN